jgi:hypothetical protein
MSGKDDLLGSFVVIFAVIGFFLSTHVVEERMSWKDEPQKSSDFAQDEQHVDAQYMGEPQNRVAQIQPKPAISEVSTGRGKYCLDMNGKAFGWHWANVPFAALACSDRSLR